MNTRHGPALVHPILGSSLVLAATALFSTQDAAIKWLADEYSLFQILFLRAVIGVAVLAVVIRWRYGKGGMHTTRPWDHALRAAFNLMAFLSFYYAVTHMPLASATAIVLTAPVIMSLLSGPVAGEPASRRAMGACLLGFLGVLAIVQPETGDSDVLPALAAVSGAVFFALLSLQNRRMSTTEPSERMVFWGAMSFVVVAGATMPALWTPPSARALVLMLALGVVSTAAQFLIVHGIRNAPVFIIAPVEYCGLLWAALLGWLLFDEIPGPMVAAGSALIVTGGLYVLLARDRH